MKYKLFVDLFYITVAEMGFHTSSFVSPLWVSNMTQVQLWSYLVINVKMSKTSTLIGSPLFYGFCTHLHTESHVCGGSCTYMAPSTYYGNLIVMLAKEKITV